MGQKRENNMQIIMTGGGEFQDVPFIRKLNLGKWSKIADCVQWFSK